MLGRTMQIEALRRPFCVEEYDRMVEVGILGKEDRVELIEGEILQMSPIGGVMLRAWTELPRCCCHPLSESRPFA